MYKSKYSKLIDYLTSEHDLILLESDIQEIEYLIEKDLKAIEVIRCCVNDDCKKTKALEENNDQRKENFNTEVGLLKTVKMDSDLLGSLNTLMKNDKFKKPTKKRF